MINTSFFLKDFYNNQIYQLMVGVDQIPAIKLTGNTDCVCSGFYANETCGFFSKKKEVDFALFVEGKEVFLLCEGKIGKILGSDFSIKRTTFIPLITKIQIQSQAFKFKCIQWSRDVDPFFMDDFFYYLKYQVENKFENFIEYWSNGGEFPSGVTAGSSS